MRQIKQFIGTTLASPAESKGPENDSEQRCVNQLRSTVLQIYNVRLSPEDALLLVRLKPSSLSGAARALLDNHESDMIHLISEARTDRRVLNRRIGDAHHGD